MATISFQLKVSFGMVARKALSTAAIVAITKFSKLGSLTASEAVECHQVSEFESTLEECFR